MTIQFDGDRMRLDAVRQGLTGKALARKAKVSQMAVSRFFRGMSKSPTTAKKLAAALGFTIDRYLLSDGREVSRHG